MPTEAWDLSDQEEEPWVIYTRQNSTTAPLANSSGCSVRNDNPVVRLRWTDRDLVAMAADYSQCVPEFDTTDRCIHGR